MSEVFWVAFVSTTSGFLLKLVSMIYKSKCTKCSICCITCKRNVELEEKEFEFNRLNPSPKAESKDETIV